jgi:hypothetical protein
MPNELKGRIARAADNKTKTVTEHSSFQNEFIDFKGIEWEIGIPFFAMYS